jgi:hypothetical protein
MEKAYVLLYVMVCCRNVYKVFFVKIVLCSFLLKYIDSFVRGCFHLSEGII